MLFVINPTAARGRALRDWGKAQRELRERGIKFNEHLTSRPGEACEVTRQALLAGEVCVIAVGGDGTLNEVVSGYFDEAGQPVNPQACIGLLPCGTGSDFCRSVGLKNRETALRAIITGGNRLIDVVKIELTGHDGQPVSRYSLNVVSFGLGGEVVRLVNCWRNTWPRWIGGHVRFVLAALQALKTYRNQPVQIQFEDQPNKAKDCYIFSNFLVAANGRFAGGGMKFAPLAELDDGLMDVVLTDRAERFDILKELPRIRFGAHLCNPKVRLVKSSGVTINAWPPLPVDVDGETAGFTPARLTIKPAALRFIAGTPS
ncbi:MAG: diacylglycerol kinase family lipid kinase [Acidobacteriota bacterium]|nr:diacylglycerol kinase family lipid kinase [Acidobacteriota bacterium]